MRTGRMKYGPVVAAVLALTGCWPWVIEVDGMLSDDMNNPECPHAWVFPRVGPPLTPQGPQLTTGSGGIGAVVTATQSPQFPNRRTNVPEFHDCQKLRMWDSLRTMESYGPLAGVFAGDNLEFIEDSTLTEKRALALVYLPQGGAYPPLGLTKPFACVIVQRSTLISRAWIVPIATETECPSPGAFAATAAPSLVDLHVLPPPPGMPGDSIPPVARWDWDETTHTQYIGVRCGESWCEIGVPGFNSSPSHDPGPNTPKGRAGYALRGAHDEQRLAEFPGHVLSPAMNLGTVVPMDSLATLTAERPSEGRWVSVARTHLAPSTGTYEEKLNIASTAAVSPTDVDASIVALCVSTDRTRCAARGWKRTLDVSRCTPDPTGARWIARVERPKARSRYFCVLYREHEAGFFVPPVVRWRWRADDETIWISCPSGCCEVKART